jgi:hypothetical protein
MPSWDRTLVLRSGASSVASELPLAILPNRRSSRRVGAASFSRGRAPVPMPPLERPMRSSCCRSNAPRSMGHDFSGVSVD